jgi:hypothetical protein
MNTLFEALSVETRFLLVEAFVREEYLLRWLRRVSVWCFPLIFTFYLAARASFVCLFYSDFDIDC